MRVLPVLALVVQREVNDEARSDRHRKRGHFGPGRWGGRGGWRIPPAATALREPIARRPILPKAAARFAAGAFRATRLAIPTRTVRQPPAVVASATIKTSGTGEKKKTLARSPKRFGKPGDRGAGGGGEKAHRPTLFLAPAAFGRRP